MSHDSMVYGKTISYTENVKGKGGHGNGNIRGKESEKGLYNPIRR